jgi:hypothetical protein
LQLKSFAQIFCFNADFISKDKKLGRKLEHSQIDRHGAFHLQMVASKESVSQ